MKFDSNNSAQYAARKYSRESGVKHIAVKTNYWDMDQWELVKCWTVAIRRIRAKRDNPARGAEEAGE